MEKTSFHSGDTAHLPKGLKLPKVVVKFPDQMELNYTDHLENTLNFSGFKEQWSELQKKFPGVTLNRHFRTMKPEEIKGLMSKAHQLNNRRRPSNLLNYFSIDCQPGTDPEELKKTLQSYHLFSTVYVDYGPEEPPVNASDDPRSSNQGYLDAAPDGINARYAWTVAGGDGSGINFVDMEQGWNLGHEDLPAGISIISGVSNAYFFHGTSVLGEVVAADNTVGCIGIAPSCTPRVVSEWRTTATFNSAEAILSALTVLNPGDVLLLEAQRSFGTYSLLPLEVLQAEFDAIQLATALGVAVVEAAGNGGNDLDTVNIAGLGFIFNRSSADFRDSGAIIVGAASSTAPHSRLSFSNFGSRIDCYGWGQNVDTLTTDSTGTANNQYTSTFNGTSSASPIVTGAATIVQAVMQAAHGYRYSPYQLRSVLSDPANGTTSATPATDRIGVMPNLQAIIDNEIGVSPDVYIRDYVGDTGDVHMGAISASPDVILSINSVANPQASFGEGSGTENNNMLGYVAEAGQDNFIYVRTRNRGGTDAANVNASVFWSPVATLVTPDLWTLVGSITIPNVPVGNTLTVSGGITWPAASIPGTGHYCFVALIGNGRDPAPSPADFNDWNNFYSFIRDNNNVTWRNFNVENNIPPAGSPVPDFVQLPFLLTGAHDKARNFDIQIVSKLPRGARFLLEAPAYLGQKIFDNEFYWEQIRMEQRVRIPLKHQGIEKLRNIELPARLRAQCKLLVQIPKQYRNHFYEVSVRQFHNRLEVGRITWNLGPVKVKGAKPVVGRTQKEEEMLM